MMGVPRLQLKFTKLYKFKKAGYYFLVHIALGIYTWSLLFWLVVVIFIAEMKEIHIIGRHLTNSNSLVHLYLNTSIAVLCG